MSKKAFTYCAGGQNRSRKSITTRGVHLFIFCVWSNLKCATSQKTKKSSAANSRNPRRPSTHSEPSTTSENVAECVMEEVHARLQVGYLNASFVEMQDPTNVAKTDQLDRSVNPFL